MHAIVLQELAAQRTTHLRTLAARHRPAPPRNDTRIRRRWWPTAWGTAIAPAVNPD